MGKRLAERFDDDDYFAEPNYDKLSDEELDELYYFGKLRSPSRKKASSVKPAPGKAGARLFSDQEEDNWLDVDLDGDDDLYEDD